MRSFAAVFLSSCLLATVSAQANHTLEGPSNSVKLTFYQVAPGAWNVAAFKDTMVERFNKICKIEYWACGLASAPGDFTANEVVIEPGFPMVKEGTKDTDVQFYMAFPVGASPSASGETRFVITGKELMEQLKGVRIKLQNAVNSYITYIGDEFHGIPPADLANRIVIPIAVLTLILMIVITCGLNYLQKRKLNKERRDYQLSVVKETSKVSPVYNIKTSERTDGYNMDKQNNSRQKKDDWYRDKNDLKKRERKEQNENDLDHPQKQQTTLPPLKQGMESDDEQKRERKKKKKKKHRKRDEDDGQVNLGYQNDVNDTPDDNQQILQAEYQLTTEL